MRFDELGGVLDELHQLLGVLESVGGKLAGIDRHGPVPKKRSEHHHSDALERLDSPLPAVTVAAKDFLPAMVS